MGKIGLVIGVNHIENIMATHYEEESLKQDVVARQERVHALMSGLTSFMCTSCWQVNLSNCSAEYLMMLDKMKRALYNVLGIMRDLFANMPIQCACMIKLEDAIHTTFEMTRYLCSSYDNAYSINREDEGEAIKLYEAIYKDAYKFHVQFVHVLTHCLQSHTFLQAYHYPAPKCVGCRYRDDFSSEGDYSSSSNSSTDQREE